MLCFYTPRRILRLATASEDFLSPQGHLETPLSAREKSESPHLTKHPRIMSDTAYEILP